MVTKLCTALFSIVGGLVIPSAAFADRCSADAQPAASTVIHSNKYLFSFDVNAGNCDQYACRGYVKFAITYHYPDGDSAMIARWSGTLYLGETRGPM